MLKSARRDKLVARLRLAGCVFAEAEAEDLLATARDDTELEAMTARRESGVPLEHVVGWAMFHGLRIIVRDGVFIPRSRSEALVKRAIPLLSPEDELVEICCGTAALALTCANAVPGVGVTVSDIDPAAVACAAENLGERGVAAVGDLFDSTPSRLRGHVRVILANVPYVPTSELALLPRDALDGEPVFTHDGGSDGLDVFRRVVLEAGVWLAPGGALLVELHQSQVDSASAAARRAGFDVSVEAGDHGQRVFVASRPR